MAIDSPVHALVLIPTKLEAQTADLSFDSNQIKTEVCGFGPIGSAIGATRAIHQHNPKVVYLFGIAGSLNPELKVGDAATFASVVQDGIGIAGEKNFPVPQIPDLMDTKVSDEIELLYRKSDVDSQLLTVYESTSDSQIIEARKQKFPNAVAEDMEGYSVALVCKAMKLPLMVVRGISNVAGDRDKKNWQIDEALFSAKGLLHEILEL